MSDPTDHAPHFLRVVRALANVRGATLPIATITTVVAGLHCGWPNGAVSCRTDCGTTGSETSSATGAGGAVGVTVMPDGGHAASSTSTTSSGGQGGGAVGVVVMPDGGFDAH